jgi:hypothetical protein
MESKILILSLPALFDELNSRRPPRENRREGVMVTNINFTRQNLEVV